MMYKWCYILLIFSSVISYGQISFKASSDKSDYDAGEIINVTVVLETNGVAIYDQSYLKLPDIANKFNLIGNGSYKRSFTDPSTNTIITQTFYRIALEAKQKGKLRFGSILVDINDKRYKTEPFNVFIRDVEKKSVASKSVDNEVYLNVDVDDNSVYLNEPTIAVLRAYSKSIDNLRKVKNIKLPDYGNVNTKLISLNKSEIDPSGYEDMPTQVLAVFMVFPNESGYIDVHPVSATVSSNSRKKTIHSNKLKLNVKKLPKDAPENYTNAVGRFKMSIHADSTMQYEMEKPMKISIKLSGDGNFETLSLPKIASSPNYEVFPPKIVSKVKASKDGNIGEVIAHYILIPKISGEFAVKTESFAFFDPKSAEYQNVEVQVLNVNVLSHTQVLEAQSTLEKVNEYTNTVLETVNTPILKTSTLKVKEKNKINWKTLWLNGGLLLLSIIGFLGFKKWKRIQNEKAVKTSKPLGSVAETESELRKKIQSDPADYFHYLKNLNEKGDKATFFAACSDLDNDVRKQKGKLTDTEFNAYLFENRGTEFLEKYKKIIQKIQIEKYAPHSTAEGMQNLYHDIVEIYSEIIK